MNPTCATQSCPACKAGGLRESIEEETFPYGEEGTQINVSVPVIRCSACNFTYTDQRAERARHSAICQHLGLLSPEQIFHIRKHVLRMSRDSFHEAFGLSSASVERWENGKLLQGEAADTLIRALADTAIAQRLDRRKVKEDNCLATEEMGNVIWGRFPSLGRNLSRAEDARARSKEFNLRMQAR